MRSAPHISRRQFAKRALGAASVFLASDYSKGSESPNERLQVALIGCGGRGQSLLSHFRAAGADVVAVCDPDENRMLQARKLAGGAPFATTDFRRVLDRREIDAVIVATPDHWHAIPAVMACEAGKDVYLEKPLAYSVAEGRAIVNAAARSGRVVQIGTQQRSGEHYKQAVALVQSGALGKVSRVRVWNVWNDAAAGSGSRGASIGNPPDGPAPPGVDYGLWLGPARSRPFNPNRFHWNYVYFWDYAGGMMTGWGIHHLDIVHWAMRQDTPRSVSAAGGNFALNDARETPDTLDALFEYDGFTVQASFYHGSGRLIEGRDYGVAFYGTQGTMILNREGCEIWPEGDAGDVTVLSGTPIDGPHQHAFIEACKQRVAPAGCDAMTGHLSTVPVLLANIAYRTGRKLYWNADTERFTGDSEANSFLSREYRRPWTLSAGRTGTRGKRGDR